MHNPKILIMTIACVITFTVTPLAAAENIASHSTASGNLLLAQAHEQHADHNGKHDKKQTTDMQITRSMGSTTKCRQTMLT